MSLTHIGIHHATAITIARHGPNNGNAISLEVCREGGALQNVEIVIYDLPSQVTDALIAVLGEPQRVYGVHAAPILEAAE